MDGTVWLNLLSLSIALTALGVSSHLTRRQATYTRSQVVMHFAAFFTEARDLAFIEDVRYVCERLPSEFPQVVAISELPDGARGRVYRVTNYFDQLGLLVAARALDADLVIGLMGNWLDECWRALEPYILSERRARVAVLERGESVSAGYLEFFADLVVRTRQTPPKVAQKNMRLRDIEELP